ncbi:Unc-89 [Cordylochernes scorpioides]|uniref:Unc-89 n=1 Tax=Cordylochernes scorpioides TaxID=51811 RepID=A0ABY6KZ44_9ARAC|nr:Unc-89 [Cordylochernes scorpioides]
MPQLGTEGSVFLVFEKAMARDAGKYTLVAANEEGEARSTAPVVVNQPPNFPVPLEPVSGVEGLPAQLQCQVTGVPTPTITWLKDDKPLPSSLHPTSLPDGTQSLVLDKLTPQDAGVYSCNASNPHGTASTDTAISVSNVSVQEGKPFRLETTVAGNPRPQPSWFLDDQPVHPSRNIIQAFNDNKVSLEVLNSNPQHAGGYECRLVSPEGDASTRCRVTVLPLMPPEFIQALADMEEFFN